MRPLVNAEIPTLITERLILRPLQPGDDQEIYALRTDESVNKFLNRPQAKSLEEAQAFITKIINNVDRNETVYKVITLKGNDKLVGTILLWNIVPEESKAEIGYELLPPYWGKGIMQEAFSKVIEFSFNTLKLQTIEAYVNPKNDKSIRFIKRNGFRKRLEQNSGNQGEVVADVIYYLHSDDKR